MNIFILWNNTTFAHALSKHFGKQNVICTKEDWSDALTNLNNYDSLIVLCELNWSLDGNKKNLQDFHGIKLVKHLRLDYNIYLPVLFVSFLPLKKIFTEERKIIKAIGHDFLQLPCNPWDFNSALKKINPLTSTELLDIRLFSCQPAGIVNEIIHHIQSLPCKLDTSEGVFLKEQVEENIKRIYSVFNESPTDCIDRFRSEFPVLDKTNINNALRFVEDEGKRIIDRFSLKADGEISSVKEKKKPWKLLLLDDEITKDSDFVKHLVSRGVDVICTTNAEDAIDALTEDKDYRGKITLILTDYRLKNFDDGIEVQHKTQGYTFLQNVGNRFQSRLISAIVYSGMPRQFLMDTYKTFKIRTEIYSKIDFKLTDLGARNFLATRIIETGDANYEALLALPLSSSGWEDHLHNTYLQFRNLQDYEIRERAISDFCTDWVEKFRKGENPETPMIKGDTFNAGKAENESTKMQRFEAFYKTRRLAQYLNLFFMNRKDPDVQRSITKHLARYAKPTSYSTDVSIRRFISQTLGLKLDEFPFGATIEDICWFEYDMQIKLLDGYKRYRAVFNNYEELIGDFISYDKKLIALLEDHGFKIEGENQQVVHFSNTTYQPYIFDKTDVGVCVDWLNKQKNNFTEQGMKDFLELIEKMKVV